MGARPAGSQRRPGMSAWALIILLLHAACATSVPRGMRVGAPSGPPAVAAEAEAGDERVHLSLSTRFGAVRVSDSELDEALATLVLNVPLRLADCPVPLYLHRKLALASAPLTGEEWRTPLARSYGSFCERQGTPG